MPPSQTDSRARPLAATGLFHPGLRGKGRLCGLEKGCDFFMADGRWNGRQRARAMFIICIVCVVLVFWGFFSRRGFASGFEVKCVFHCLISDSTIIPKQGEMTRGGLDAAAAITGEVDH